MKRKLLAIAVCMMLFVAGFEGLRADGGLGPWNHRTNPAFFAFGNREIFELGVSTSMGIGNSALGLSDVFSRVVVIDLDEVYADTPNDGLRVGASAEAELHLALQFGKLGFGLYTDAYDLSRTVIPRTFIGLLTQGNEPNQSYSSSAEILQRAFAQAGMFASYQIGGFVFAGKIGAFSPMLYSDENAEAGFMLETASDGTFRGEVFASGDIYTAIGEDGLQGLGFNVSLGLVRPDEEGNPRYGAGLNNIPLVAAKPGYVIEVEQLRYEFEATDLLDRLERGEEPFTTASQIGDVQTRPLDPSDQPKIHMPFSVSGFYRFAVPVVDIVPDAEVVFDNPVRLNAGLVVEGNIFPANLFSVGFGRRDYLWYATAGFRIPLRVFELALQVASVGTVPRGIFDASGLGATLSLALGY
ncbi:MAG: hypothetical protein JSV89_10415 [Spirochaetaceae bacterium]|nr:MAG: hypothetical protein JSV89_10415 [Spirochaetaceae bacterium]